MANTNKEVGSTESYAARTLRNKKKIIEAEKLERENNNKTYWGKRKNLEKDLDSEVLNENWEKDYTNSQKKMTNISDKESAALSKQYSDYQKFQKDRTLNNPNLHKGTSYQVFGLQKGYKDAYSNNLMVGLNTSTNESGHIFDENGVGKIKKDGKWVSGGGRFTPTIVSNEEGETIGYDFHSWKSSSPEEWDRWQNNMKEVKNKHGESNFYKDFTGSNFKNHKQ